MMGPEHRALIAKFKELTSSFRAIGLYRDAELERFAIAWASMQTNFEWPEGVAVPEEANPDSWMLLWSAVKMSMDDAAMLAGVSRERAIRIFGILKGAKIIFPDGTLSDQSEEVLKLRMQKYMDEER